MSLFGVSKAASGDHQKCIICEHIGFASTEFAAHLNLLGVRKADDGDGKKLQDLYLDADGVPMTQENNYCLTAMIPTKVDTDVVAADIFDNADTPQAQGTHAPPAHIQTIGSGTNGYSYCVAQFFVYYAQDINK